MTNMSFLIAFSAGLLSFFSPCVFPLIPCYILYLAGMTINDYHASQDRHKTVTAAATNALVFVLGFSLVFVAMGAAASFLGRVLFQYSDIIRMIGGAVIVFLGSYLAGAFRFKFMDVERRIDLRLKPAGYLSSFIIGITFAAAWTPCAGPILGSILVLAGAAKTVNSGVALLAAYSLGLGIPFVLTSLFINSALIYFKKIERYLRPIMIACGIFLIGLGVLLLTNRFDSIISYLNFPTR